MVAMPHLKISYYNSDIIYLLICLLANCIGDALQTRAE